jgi:ABC-type transport system substrate-binding protein
MSKKFRQLAALLMAMCMVLSLVACGSGSSSDSEDKSEESESSTAATNGGTTQDAVQGSSTVESIVVGLEGDAGTLAPFAFLSGYGNVGVSFNIYEKLCHTNADGSTSMTMIKNVEEIDELTYDITIYDYIYDSAGNNITASDVVFCLETSISFGNSGAFPDFESATVIDDYTFEWKNATPFGANMMYKEFSNLVVVSQKAYEESGDGMATAPVTTSPYVVTEYTPGSSIVLERRDDYWQTDESLISPTGIANVDRIEYKIILDSSQMSMALEAGSIDVAGSLSDADLTYFEDDSEYNIIDIPGVMPYLCLLNATDSSQCSDINLRKAILKAIDPNAIVAACTVKLDALTSLSAHCIANYDTAWDSRTIWDADTTEAAAFLSDSSYDGSTLKLLCMSDSVSEAAAMVIQSELDSLGITVSIETVDMGTLMALESDPTAYDILVAQNGGGAYVEQCWNNAFSYASGKTAINDPVLEEKLNEIVATADADKLTEFQDYVDEMAYGKGLVIPTYQTASNKTMEQAFLGPDGVIIRGASVFAS